MFAWFNTHKVLTLLLAVLLSVVVLVAFSKYIDSEINKTIHTEASDISQCKMMPVGHKACGGPGSYIVYSTKTTDVDRYLKLVATRDKFWATLQWLFNPILGSGGASTCDIEMPPEVEFANGKCLTARR
ncbi:MAG: hypothetical protein Q7R58_00635 [bacterium]|nr:hypothetical protein [bacterium]